MTRTGLKVAARSAGFTGGFVGMIFGPAETLDYWQAWALLGVFAICGALLSAYMWKHDRALLERRMRHGPLVEQSIAQRIIVTLLYAGFIGEFVLGAFDRRLGWSAVPTPVVIVGDAIVALGFYMYFTVLRENSFASAAVEISAGQHVISSGPYRIVRHPMYVGMLLLFLGIPLAMGSYVALASLVILVPVVAWRLLDEEQFLIEKLPGYAGYRTRTRWRLVPGIF